MNNSAEPQSTQPAAKGSLEPSDANFKAIVFFLIGLIVVSSFIHAGLTFWFNKLQVSAEQEDKRVMLHRVAPSVLASRTYFPTPREQISPRLDLQTFLARQNAELNSYGWVDESNGVVRIPIDRAIELVSQRGLPSFGGSKTSTSSLELQQQRATQSSTRGSKESR